jgi:hypothetical protein
MTAISFRWSACGRLFLGAILCGSTLTGQSPRDEEKSERVAPAVANPADEPGSPSRGELSEQESAFAAMLKNATLRGSWAPIDKRLLGEEQEDGYRIVRAEKISGSQWTLISRFKFQGKEVNVPFPVIVHFAGDAAVMALDKIPLGDGSLWSARILFHDDVYAGSWWGADKAVKSGVVSGTITREP